MLSILEGRVLDQVLALWKLFEAEYGSIGVQSLACPNITFQGAYCDDLTPVAHAVSDPSRRLRPIELTIDGFGCFEARSKFVFLKVVLTEDLRRVNRAVNNLLQKHCHELVDEYLPERWVPHITAAMSDLTDRDFERARQDLSRSHPPYKLIVSNMHLVQRDERTGRIETIRRYLLKMD